MLEDEEFTFQPGPVIAAFVVAIGRTIREFEQSPLGDRIEYRLRDRFDQQLENLYEQYLREEPSTVEYLRQIRSMVQKEIDGRSSLP